MTLVIGKYCAGAGFGVRGVAAVFMAIPGCWSPERSVVSEGSVRAAADSHPHSGLVERLNIVDAAPRRCGLGCRGLSRRRTVRHHRV